MVQISLKAARSNANMTQAEAAKAFGVALSKYRAWEKDPGSISITYSRLIQEVFGVPVDSIIFLPNE